MPDMQDKGCENGGGHQEARRARNRKKVVCPYCGDGDQVIPIHYGLPTHENSQKAWRGELFLGGYTPGPYRFYCKRDNREF